MFIWSGNADELLDRGQFSPPLPVHEPLQTSQLLTNLLMLDWSDMLEPQRLQSTASLARPNTVIEKTWASAQPIKHRQLQAARSNRVVTGQSWSVLFWKWYITRRSHPSAGLLDPSDSMSELRLFFFLHGVNLILFFHPSLNIACRQLGACWFICASLLILPFCRCIAIGINTAEGIRLKTMESWLFTNTTCVTHRRRYGWFMWSIVDVG